VAGLGDEWAADVDAIMAASETDDQAEVRERFRRVTLKLIEQRHLLIGGLGDAVVPTLLEGRRQQLEELRLIQQLISNRLDELIVFERDRQRADVDKALAEEGRRQAERHAQAASDLAQAANVDARALTDATRRLGWATAGLLLVTAVLVVVTALR
jgi:hypothetical protein